MSNCKSYDYPVLGDWLRTNMSYAQAIRVGDRIHCSGQGGWDTTTIPNPEFSNLIKPTLAEEFDQAFANCDLNLRNAGGKGFEQVYKVVTYSTDIGSAHEHIVRNLRKWMPGHRAIWTSLGVKALGGGEQMHFEIDVEAFDPEGASKVEN